MGIKGYNRVQATIKLATGQITRLRPSYNARTNVGAALCAYLISGSNLGSLSSPGIPKYIAISTTLLNPASTNTTLSGEVSASGLARAAGTMGGYSAPSVLDGGASYTITYTFTNTAGGATNIQSTGLFDAASTGNMLAEANLSFAASIPNAGDQVVITWTINI